MPRLPVQLNSLEIFAEAARHQSFRKAAENLCLTTSAVSQAVRKLEERLQVRLFERTGNSIRLSQEGAYLSGEVENGFEYMRRGIDTLLTKKSKQLSISTPPAVASLMVPVIHELLSLDSSDLQLVSDESPDYRSYRHFDIAVLYGPAGASQNDLEGLGPDIFMPVCRPDVAEQLRKAGNMSNIPLLVNETSAVTWDHWLKLNEMVSVKNKRLQFNRSSHIISTLLSGVGIALETLRLTSRYISDGQLVCCPLGKGKAIRREFTFLYVREDPLLRERTYKVAALIREQCATGENGYLKTICGD